MIAVNYTASFAPVPQPDAGGAKGQGLALLRFPVGIEVVSPGFEVYPGAAGMGGNAREFAVFYAKRPLPPAGAGTPQSVEIAIRVVDTPAPPRNFVDVRLVGIGGGPPAGSSAVLEAREGVVYFAAVPAGADGGSPALGATPPVEMSSAHHLPASSPDALPAPGRLAAHLAGALPPGADVAAWLVGHAAHMPASYREAVEAAYSASAAVSSPPRGAAGAAGASPSPPPTFPFPTISSYVYGTLFARGSDGVVRGQPGVAACMYDVGDDNRTLTLLDNLADPSDPLGACTTTNGTGFFDMSVLTLDPTDPLSPVDLRIVFRAAAHHSRIADAHNGTYELHAATVGNLSGPIVGLNVTVPDSHEFRRALWVMSTIGSAHARIAAEFGHDAPAADVRWDPASPAASSYNRTSGTVTVSSVHGWGSRHGTEASPASIAHVYAQHVLSSLRGDGAGPGCPLHLRVDLPAAPGGCAWRSGWAHFAAAVVQDSPSLRYHHLPVAVDLEAPAYDVGGRHVYGFARGADVPGNVAGALWDLYDGPGEPGDTVDGAGAAVWNATVGMRRGSDPSILDFWYAWAGNRDSPPMRGVLALNGIYLSPGAPPALAVINASLSVPYGGTARAAVNATAAGYATLELADATASGTGRITPPPAFANLTYRYEGDGLTAALVTLSPNASDVGTYLLNVTARTQDGLSGHTLISVNVTDPVPPYFAAVPWDVYVEATGNLTAINAATLGVHARDEADPRPAMSHSPAGPLPLGSHYVRWTATDASNNSATAVMYMVIRDTTPPSLEGVANLTLAFAPGARPAAAYAVPNATDLVDGGLHVSCWPRQGSHIPWGTTTVTCDASDRSGNYAWAQFSINATRDDTLGGPALSESNSTIVLGYNRTAHVEVNATAAGPATISLAAVERSHGSSIVPPPAFANLTYRYAGNGTTAALVTLAPNATDIGVHLLNVTARTQSGLSGHTVIRVNVTYPVPPYFAAVPWDVVLEAEGPLTQITAAALGVHARDEADPDPELSRVPAGPLPLGDHLVRWTATDASNNSAAAAMRLFVVDTTPPSFSGLPANASLHFAPGETPLASYTRPNATDIVDGDVPVRCSPPPGSHVLPGPTLVACDASDESGNSARVSFWFNSTRTGNLTAQPRLALSDSIVVVPYGNTERVRANVTGTVSTATVALSSLGALGRPAPPPAFATLEHVDAGGNATDALITLSPNASDIGVHRINVTAVLRGFSQVCAVLTVNVTDGTPPRLSVPAEAAVEATGNLTRVNASALGVVIADAVDPSPALSGGPPGSLSLGVHSVRWTATDASGNVASAWMRLAVRDTTPPVRGRAQRDAGVSGGGAARSQLYGAAGVGSRRRSGRARAVPASAGLVRVVGPDAGRLRRARLVGQRRLGPVLDERDRRRGVGGW